MPLIEITQEAFNALELSKFETASDAILSAIPKRTRKPIEWKRFFEAYPPNKKGGNDSAAWKKAKAMKLTVDDFALMASDVVARCQADHAWAQQYAHGICKYIEQEIWKTPLPNQIEMTLPTGPVNAIPRSTRDISTQEMALDRSWAD